MLILNVKKIKDKMFMKLLASTLIAFVLMMSVAPTVTKAVWYNQSFNEFHTLVHDSATPPQEIFGERYTYAQVQWIIYSLIDFAINIATNQKPEIMSCGMELTGGGTGGEECAKAVTSITSSSVGGSHLASIPQQSFLNFMLSDRPLSFVSTANKTIKKFNPATEVNAQTGGFGYDTALGDMIQDLWTHARNISYSLFIFMAIILAFMIMFRVKLNPQTVISIQSAIPKLFITLILITFSYSIAGFMVDLMYVVIGLFALMIGPAIDNDNLFSVLTTGLQGTGVWGFAVLNIFGMMVALIMSLGAMLGGVFEALSAAVFLFSGFWTIQLILFAIVAVVFFIILFWVTLKIIMTLLRAYVEFVLNVITGPLQIAIGVVIPGAGFGSWLRRIAGSLAVFPIAGMLFTFSYVFLILSLKTINVAGIGLGGVLVDIIGLDLREVSGTINAGDGWPPLIGTSHGDIAPMALFMLSFAFYAMIPKAADMIKGFMTGRGFSVSSAIGEAAAIGGFAGGAVSGAAMKASQNYVGGAMGEGVGAAWSAIQYRRFPGAPTGSALARRIGSASSTPPGRN